MAKSRAKKDEDEEESELSDAPSALSEEYTPVSILKRKRGVDTPTTTTTSIKSKDDITSTKALTSSKKPRRPPTKKAKPSIKTEDGLISPPANWQRVYSLTQEMRANITAPVDTMGCESSANPTASPKDQRLQTLIALMLSSQTKDAVTFAAIQSLESNLPGGLCLQALLDLEPDVLNGLIGKVGFHNNKTKYIKATALMLRDQFGGDIPDTVEGLTSLPGVGPKMAYLTLSAAWGRDEGIGVDVHVHRITNLWGWHKTTNPEDTRKKLEAWLPRDKWHEINNLLVGFGQMLCLPVGRKCGECKLAKEGLCPGAVTQVKREITMKRKREVKIEGNSIEEEMIEAKREMKVEEVPVNATENVKGETGVDEEILVKEKVKTKKRRGDSVDMKVGGEIEIEEGIKLEAIGDIEDLASIISPPKSARTRARRIKIETS
jgi:endonuclease-3